MSLTRNYVGGAGEYASQSSAIQVAYTVAGTDGSAVTGQINPNYLLTQAQIDELANALQKACAGLSWVTFASAEVTEHGARTWSVSEIVTPPV